MGFFILFDGQFRIVKTVEQLCNLHLSLNDIPEVANFLNTFNRQANSATPVATTFITILNDTLKYLAKGARKVPSWILDRLEMIFEMPCQKFDLQYETIILFRSDINDQKINESSIQQLVDMFNGLIEYSQNAVSTVSKYWPIALSILAFCCTLYYLEKTYTKVKYNIPLSDDQKNRFVEYLGRLHDILEKICQNLLDRETDNFHANIRILQNLLENDYVPFLRRLNNNLKNQLHELQERENNETYKAIFAALVTGVSLYTFIRTIYLGSNLWMKASSGVATGVSGGYTVHKTLNITRLKEVIDKYNSTIKIFEDTQKFLCEVRDYVDKNDTEEPPCILYQQFRSFRDQASNFKQSIAELK